MVGWVGFEPTTPLGEPGLQPGAEANLDNQPKTYFRNLNQKGNKIIPIIGINAHIRFKNSIIKFVLILLALIASLSATSNLLKSLHNA